MFYKINKLYRFILCSFFFISSAQAELIILKQKKDNDYEAISSKSTQSDQAITREIFENYILKYQWPMITTHFYDMEKADQNDYLAALKEEHGVTKWIQKKIDEKYKKGSFKIVHFPTTLFEITAINSFMHNLIKANIKEKNFGDTDFRMPGKFMNIFTPALIAGLKNNFQKENADLKALKSATENINKSDASFLLYLDTVLELNQQIKVDNFSCEDAQNFIDITFKTPASHKSFFAIRSDYLVTGKEIAYLFPSDAIVNGALHDCEAEKTNSFLLYRGTKGLEIDSRHKIIDSPYRESAPDFSEIKAHKPDVKLAIEMTPASFTNEFTPSSLSYGNSLFAGTFFDAGDKSARAINYMKDQFVGYALKFPIADFFEKAPRNKVSLRQKYYIAPLYSLAALFGNGELFHSRSKVSVFSGQKIWSGAFEGFYAVIMEKDAISLDRWLGSGFLVSPNIDWLDLHTGITYDIGEHSLLVTPDYASKWKGLQESQLIFANFSIQAGKLLKEIATEKKLLIDEKPKDNRSYDIGGFHSIKTKLHVQLKNSLSFDDLRKRTKEHVLVIPTGKYISFSHFVDNASEEEMKDLLDNIVATSKKLGLDKTGYRIITNHSLSPNSQKDNDAKQEVPHFHIHLAGGECLGKPVTNSGLSMDIDETFLDFKWNNELFIEYALSHAIGERHIDKKKYLAFRMPTEKNRALRHYIGFLLLDENDLSVYQSAHDFFTRAQPLDIKNMFVFINDTAKTLGIFETGFRLIADHGHDAWQSPQGILNFTIAGGTELGITVTNVYGNKKLWQANITADYDDLSAYPHEHCPENLALAYKIAERIRENPPDTVAIITANKKLDFTREELTQFPVIDNPEEISHLTLNDNALVEIPDLNRFVSLNSLRISENKLTKFPEAILKRTSIQSLSLSDNQIRYIPDEIGEMVNLKNLDLSKNKITSLPASIGKLKNLNTLNLGENNITCLPASIGELTSLKRLNLGDNEIVMDGSKENPLCWGKKQLKENLGNRVKVNFMSDF